LTLSARALPLRANPSRATGRRRALNAPAAAAAADADRGGGSSGRYPFLIVPGYTPRFGWRGGLHPKNVRRLERALLDLEAGVAPSVIVSGGAVHSPDNEAVLMREWLLDHGVSPRRILVEPCARHTTTRGGPRFSDHRLK
jgi:hypothetical protein